MLKTNLKISEIELNFWHVLIAVLLVLAFFVIVGASVWCVMHGHGKIAWDLRQSGPWATFSCIW